MMYQNLYFKNKIVNISAEKIKIYFVIHLFYVFIFVKSLIFKMYKMKCNGQDPKSISCIIFLLNYNFYNFEKTGNF